ncbi:hypothetical protein PULV_a1677 [Pseudoalteromonas ulvae UL12]|uniref:DUF2589 domain-containing protein n=1 Tax=Pseudoalteromonas ulvae TaxID=107327 RepID=UPI00186B986E|nr:DUF2589 domain-containing protein [Pseudoalteromonas ulvae]MBE0364117.1 hypothetical protein [Pseudoalteromonas ulvae UL12]
MIKFSQLVSAIQNSVEEAAFSVSQENFKTLLSYFHTEKRVNASESNEPTMHEQPLTPDDFEALVPKSVCIQFPKDDNSTHDVHVPLIALTPINNIQLSEMEIDIDMEIMEKDGDILIGFPSHKKSLFGSSSAHQSANNARVKIKIAPGGKPTGVTTIIEGYEKVLRAQVPN